jgi:hypothetical protein
MRSSRYCSRHAFPYRNVTAIVARRLMRLEGIFLVGLCLELKDSYRRCAFAKSMGKLTKPAIVKLLRLPAWATELHGAFMKSSATGFRVNRYLRICS